MAGDESRGISAVILAAGANTRLSGPNLVPPYMKPLILVNGRPLVHHAIDHANEWNCGRHIIVCSPDNARMLTQVVQPDEAAWVLQPEPMGVVDAITRALPYVNTEWTLILCADNTFSKLPDTPYPTRPMFGMRKLDQEQSLRFTRFRFRGPLHVENGIALLEPNDTAALCDGCWIGPLLLPTQGLRIATDGRLKVDSIIRLIQLTTDNGHRLLPILMECSDLGVPEELR